MKIYDFGNGEYFEVIDQLMLEDSAGFCIKVSRYISPNQPKFTFRDDVFFNVSFGVWAQKKEITEEEFCEELKKTSAFAWKPIIDKMNSGQFAIKLTDLQISTSKSFRKTPSLGTWSEFRDKL